MLAPRLDTQNLSQTPMVKNIDRVTAEANEVFQSMAFVYLNHKKNFEDGKKLQNSGVACFRPWFGNFLVKSWFFDYMITMSIQKWTFSSYMNLIMMMKCRENLKIFYTLGQKTPTCLQQVPINSPSPRKGVDTPNPKEIFTYFYLQ